MMELFDKWDKQVNRAQSAHYAAAAHLKRGHFVIGFAIIIVSIALLATTFASLGPPVKAVAAIANLLVAILAGLQTFVRLAERAEQHRLAAVRFGALRRSLEQHRATGPPGGGAEFLDSFRTRWDELSEQSPEVPIRVWRRVDQQFFKGR